jgi:hypothetical protein
MARTLRTITVARVEALLEGLDPETPVIFTADYGDYHHTPQALPLRGEAEEVTVSESGYSSSGWRIDDDDLGDDEDLDAPAAAVPYLVIR